MEIQALAAAIANRSGLLASYSFLRKEITKSQVAILWFHRVCSQQDGWSYESLSSDSFEKYLEYFCRKYEIISLDELAQYIHNGRSLPERAVVFTFDDGYRDVYLYAYPMLKKYHAPASVFLTTGHIGSDQPLWWDQVSYAIHNAPSTHVNLDEVGNYCFQSPEDRSRISLRIVDELKDLPDEKKNTLIEQLLIQCQIDIPVNLGKELLLSWDEVKEMSNAGIDFGAHSVNHPILTNIPLAQAKDEIISSKKDIEKRLGKEATAFCYPNGNYNPAIVGLVKSSGFKCAVTCSVSLINSHDSAYELGRVDVIEDFNQMRVALCGLWGDLPAVLRHSLRK